MIDGHVHLEKGPLSKEYVLEFVQEAKKKGIDYLQILDHTHRFIEFEPLYEGYKKDKKQWAGFSHNNFRESISEYHKLINELRNYDFGIDVKFGLEVCYEPEYENIIKELLSDFKYDFLIGSVHAINSIAYDSSWSLDSLWNKYDVDYIYKKYYENVIKLVESDIFTQVGHPDTIKMFNIYPTYDLIPTYELLAKTCKEHKIKVENNVGCFYRYHHLDMGLSDELLSIFKKHQCDMITVSDAHYPKDVGTNIIDVWEKTMY